ncbi:MAG: S-layer homology domain-containing protein [Oscillospiraceae bacterium]
MKRILALTLALLAVLSLATAGAGAKTGFADDAQITSGEAVSVLSGIGILNGYENADGSYSYRPRATLTRGAGAKIIAYLVLGQTAADSLRADYTVFPDVDESVGLASYVEWCAARGIVDGYADGSFRPYGTLTQYAFGKMLLTALGYSSQREGFTGSGWRNSVRSLAERNGVFDGSETAAACDRETAARMAFGALQARVVVYSDAAVGGGYYWNDRRVEVDGSVLVGDKAFESVSTLGGLYGLVREDAADVWGNPGHRWTYAAGGWSEVYPDEAVLTYTEAVDECRLLTELGVAVGSSDTRTVDKVFYNAREDGTDIVLQHKASHSACGDSFFGGQGVLTRVYRQADGSYVVTEVASYLARVDAAAGGSASVTVAYRDLSGFGRTARQLAASADAGEKRAVLASSAYAAGDYLLVTVDSTKADAACIVDHQPVSGAAGKLTGFTEAAYPNAGSTYVGGTARKDAFGFVTGCGTSKSAAGVGSDRTFFYDAYGNVIGMTGAAAAGGYVVVEEIWSDCTAGDVSVGADVVSMDGVMQRGVNVTVWNGSSVTSLERGDNAPIKENKVENRRALCYQLYACSADSSGWSLRQVICNAKLGAASGFSVTHSSRSGKLTDGTRTVELTAKTQFLVRDTEGGYRAYTGYTELPALAAAAAQVIYAEGSTNAAVVLITGAVYDGSQVLGYILNTEGSGYLQGSDGVKYSVFDVYVDGVARTVYVPAASRSAITSTGMYELLLSQTEGRLVARMVEQLAPASAGKAHAYYGGAAINYADCAGDGKIRFKTLGDSVFDLDGVQVYVIHEAGGFITAGSFADLVNGAIVDFCCDTADGAITALRQIYVHTAG